MRTLFDFKILKYFSFNKLNTRSCDKSIFRNIFQKCFIKVLNTFSISIHTNLNAIFGIIHPTLKAKFSGKLIHKRSETNALYDAFKMNLKGLLCYVSIYFQEILCCFNQFFMNHTQNFGTILKIHFS